MKKIILLALVMLVTLSVTFGQTATKYQFNKAEEGSKYVSEKMSMNEEDTKFLYDALLTKVVANGKLKDKSSEEKKVGYKTNHQAFMKTVREKFGKDKANEINKYLKALRQKEKK